MLTVATNFFGLVQDNRLKVIIDDGIKFLKKALKNGMEIFKHINLHAIIMMFELLFRAIIQSNSVRRG